MKAKLAVVDDDTEMLALLALVLGKSGFEVKTYATPGRFLDSLARSRPDLCILDMQLPGIHGRDVIRVLRENEATKRMPIVAITASERGTPDVIKSLELGADEYMGKPLDLELFVVRIAGLLRRAPGAKTAPPPSEKLRYGPLTVILDEHRVEVAGIRGDVIDTALFTTTLLEVGPGKVGHQRTGHAITGPLASWPWS